VKKEIDPDVRERLAKAVSIIVGEEEGNAEGSSNRPTFNELYGVHLLHRGGDGDVEFEPDDESLGTLVWFGLVGPVIKALQDGAVFLADELDASLHPVLVAHLVTLFQDQKTNPRRAQLVFNSHDTTVLGESAADRVVEAKTSRLLGRDQIWFTEKANDGATRLYPLSDMDPRKDEAVERRYLAGRYGATPIVSRPQLIATARLVTNGASAEG
jgi:AAA15 family ATPase/GTPase